MYKQLWASIFKGITVMGEFFQVSLRDKEYTLSQESPNKSIFSVLQSKTQYFLENYTTNKQFRKCS